MQSALSILVVVLAASIAVGLARAVRGPTRGDRLSAALLFGTAAVAMLLTIAQLTGQDAARDVALVLVLLAAMVVIVAESARDEPPSRGADDGA